MKAVFTSILFLGFFTLTFAQNSTQPISISVDRNADGEPTFYGVNNSSTPYTVSIEFYSLENTLPPSPNPYIRTVKPGRTRLVKLRKSGGNTGGISYRYRYSYNLGCHNTKPDEELEYLLPVAEGNTTKIFKLFYIGELVNDETPDGFYSLGFSANDTDSVFASRGGTVSRIRDEFADTELDNYFTSNYNYVEVVHKDCTFGMYRHLKKGSILVEPGDVIDAGEPIGQVVPRGEEEPAQFRFILTYKNDDYQKDDDSGYWNYAVPLFRTSSAKKVTLEPQMEYVSVHPTDLITQEMGWLERRRWKRNN